MCIKAIVNIYASAAENYTAPGTTKSYRLAGDVGLLSRNIKIIGGDYPDLYSESFGARVLVGSFSAGGLNYRGIQLEHPMNTEKAFNKKSVPSLN